MKRIILLILLAVFIVFNASAKWYITSQNTNVRAGAGTHFKVIGSLAKGTKLNVSDSSATWIKVKYFNKAGFISAKLLKETQPPLADSGDRSSGISGLIGGLFGIIIIIGIIRLMLIETWRTLTGRGAGGSGGYGSTDGGLNPNSTAAKLQQQNRLDNYRKSHWGPNG